MSSCLSKPDLGTAPRAGSAWERWLWEHPGMALSLLYAHISLTPRASCPPRGHPAHKRLDSPYLACTHKVTFAFPFSCSEVTRRWEINRETVLNLWTLKGGLWTLWRALSQWGVSVQRLHTALQYLQSLKGERFGKAGMDGGIHGWRRKDVKKMVHISAALSESLTRAVLTAWSPC